MHLCLLRYALSYEVMNVLLQSKTLPALLIKKGWKEDPGNYRPVRLISVLGKVMEQLILTQHVQGNQGFKPSHDGFMQGKFMQGRFCLINLISFHDRDPTEWMRERLWLLSPWTLVKPLTSLSAAIS